MSRTQAGFTLVELLVVLGIIGALFALTFINLGKPQTTADLEGATDMLVADLKSQQLLAMSGDDGGGSAVQPHGMIISGDRYTLFAGATFSGTDDNNFAVEPGEPVTFSTTLPDGQIQFAKGSGEVQDFILGSDTITVHARDASHVISINRLGTVTVQ